MEVIRGLQFEHTTIEKLLELLEPIFRGYAVEAPRFEPGITLFRSRICGKPANIKDLWAPPPHLTPLGRVNRVGSPVLYCCTSRDVPFFESRPREGETVAVARWITTAPLLVNHVGYSIATLKTLASVRQHAGWGPRPANHPNEAVSNFLAEIFTRIVPVGSEHEYKLSVAIAEKLFADDIFDGLLYPTVAMRANADNFALKLRYANDNLRFQKAEYARIERVRDFAFDITWLDTATELEEDGTIRWKGRLDQWEIKEPHGQLTFTRQGGDWIARNQAGEVVQPE